MPLPFTFIGQYSGHHDIGKTHCGREETEYRMQTFLVPQSNAPVGAWAEKHVWIERRPLKRVHWTLLTTAANLIPFSFGKDARVQFSSRICSTRVYVLRPKWQTPCRCQTNKNLQRHVRLCFCPLCLSEASIIWMDKARCFIEIYGVGKIRNQQRNIRNLVSWLSGKSLEFCNYSRHILRLKCTKFDSWRPSVFLFVCDGVWH